MKFQHRFRVRAALSEVLDFHRSPRSLAAITPPFPPLKIVRAPDPLEPPCTMEMKLWMGPLPIRWTAALEPLPPDPSRGGGSESAAGFLDRQIEGPFRSWRHQHRFTADGPGATWVHDSIEAHLRSHPLWWAVGLVMWWGLRPMFAYRAFRTRRLLEGRSGAPLKNGA